MTPTTWPIPTWGAWVNGMSNDEKFDLLNQGKRTEGEGKSERDRLGGEEEEE